MDWTHWIKWSLKRASIWPFAMVMSHATVFIWQATDENYLIWAKWVDAWILQPLHPVIVQIVSMVVPWLTTLVRNKPPTYEQAGHWFYLVFFTFYFIIGMLLWILVAKIFRFGPNESARRVHEK